jgi:predicted metalloprotease
MVVDVTSRRPRPDDQETGVKWREIGRRGRIDDRRGAGGGRSMSGFPIPIGGKVSLPVLILAAVAFFLLNGFGGGGVDVETPVDEFPGQARQAPAGQDSVPGAPPTDAEGQFVAQVTRDIEELWQREFAAAGRRYDPVGPATTLAETRQRPGPVVFSRQTSTGCGIGSAATGPFYCPADERVYIDLSFYRELTDRFGAGGDFAQAYVLAHEVGHHVQHLLGIDEQVRRLARQAPGQRNALSVRQELQADCFAGVWAHSVYERQLLESGDVDEALTAAAAIGDDRIQQQTQGRVTPETWTHGSSAQRTEWFRRGFESGSADACDTFSSDV